MRDEIAVAARLGRDAFRFRKLRGCSQSFQQEAQEGQMYELQAGIEQTFGVFPQSSRLFKPTK
jgi:hypothetical protein